MINWVRTIPSYVAGLLVLEFPFETLPLTYVPQSTVLKLPDGRLVQSYRWCYLERSLRGRSTDINPASLSSARVAAMPKVIERLSRRSRFVGSRPRSIYTHFRYLSDILSWADSTEHAGRFEHLLADADLALEALNGYHTYLRQRLQSHQIATSTAALRDQGAIAFLSEIHGRNFLDNIEPLTWYHGGGTDAPRDEEVGQWLSTMLAIFDSAARFALGQSDVAGNNVAARCEIRLSAADDTKTVVLVDGFSSARLMELACMAFAGLAIGDSGANLAQIQRYEQPEDLWEQLAAPERITLTQKVIKFRADGKLVPVHLTATTMSRLRIYLQVRERLVVLLQCTDIAPMFVQCEHAIQRGGRTARAPVAIRALSNQFLQNLRSKAEAIGAHLPSITLRQLRSYKQQRVVQTQGVKVAAELMGHSIATAIKHYCSAQEDVRRSGMGEFLASLTSRVLDPSAGDPQVAPTESIPAGACKSHGHPIPIDVEPAVKPDCRKQEGCFFCAQFCVHADDIDTRKLLSCRYVLRRVAHLQGQSMLADGVYRRVLDRIDALAAEIRGRIPAVYEEVRQGVEERGDLSSYWAAKLQQLHLIGMLAHDA